MTEITGESEQVEELKRLVGPEAERLERDNPDLAEMLREYQKNWKAFREAVSGPDNPATAPARGRRYRA